VEHIAEGARKSGVKEVYVVSKSDAARLLAGFAREGDILLVMGAGDINQIVPETAALLDPKFSGDMKKKLGIKGNVSPFEMMRHHTTWGIGGPAELWVEPLSESELIKVLDHARKHNKSVSVVGAGSNVLADDRGVSGIILRLSAPAFCRMDSDECFVTAGAGVPLGRFVSFCAGRSLSGAEGLVGIPGTVGGALMMNAGYGCTIGDIVIEIRLMNRNGRISTVSAENIKFGYRRSGLEGNIILDAKFKLLRSSKNVILESCRELMRHKQATQPLNAKSAGCVFKNPMSGQPAGKLIDICGLKGARSGGALVSGKHANFIVNAGSATARDVTELIERVRKTVLERTGVELEPEIRML
jgi:UDP-N-acetylmuramate dehydrogenase